MDHPIEYNDRESSQKDIRSASLEHIRIDNSISQVPIKDGMSITKSTLTAQRVSDEPLELFANEKIANESTVGISEAEIATDPKISNIHKDCVQMEKLTDIPSDETKDWSGKPLSTTPQGAFEVSIEGLPPANACKQRMELSCSILLDPINIHAVTSVGQIYEHSAITRHLKNYPTDPNTLINLQTKAVLFLNSTDLLYLTEKNIRKLVQKFWVRFEKMRHRTSPSYYRELMDVPEGVDSPSEVKNAFFKDCVLPELHDVNFEGCLFSNCVLVDLENVVFKDCRFEGIKTSIHSMRSVVFNNTVYGGINDPFLLHACFLGKSQMNSKVCFLSTKYCFMHAHSLLPGTERSVLSKQREFYREKFDFAIEKYEAVGKIELDVEISGGNLKRVMRVLKASPDSYLRELILQEPPFEVLPLADFPKALILANEIQYHLVSDCSRYVEKIAIELIIQGHIDPLFALIAAIDTENDHLLRAITTREEISFSLSQLVFSLALMYEECITRSEKCESILLSLS